MLTGQAGGTFTVGASPFNVLAETGLSSVTLIPQWVAIGDVNGDGVPDLIVSISDSLSLGGDTVNYLINLGGATFAPPISVPAAASGFSPYSVALHDLNGDGLPDLALGNLGSGDFVGVLYGKCPLTQAARAGACGFCFRLPAIIFPATTTPTAASSNATPSRGR